MAELLEPPAAGLAGAAGVEHHAERVHDSRVPDPGELPQRPREERVPDGLAVLVPAERGVAQRLERGARDVGGEGGEGEHGGDDRGGAREEDEGALVVRVAREEVADEADAQEEERHRGGRQEAEGVAEGVGERGPALPGPGSLQERG